MCLSYSQIKASQGPHSLNVFCHSTNVSTSASLLLQYKPLRGTWRYLKIRIFSRNQKKKGYAIIYALKIHWVCSKRGINKKIHRPSGLTTLSLKKRSEGCLGSYFSVVFFFFLAHMMKCSVWPWTATHCFLLSLDLLLVLHLDTSLIFLSEYVCSMAKAVWRNSHFVLIFLNTFPLNSNSYPAFHHSLPLHRR